MAKVIVSATNKGGEGKTTASILLTEYCALILNKKVLSIDLDPQANFSKYFLDLEYDPSYKGGKIPPQHPDYDGRSSIADIFYGQAVTPYPIQDSYYDNIDLLPAHSYLLQEAEAVTKEEVLEKVHLQLKRFVELPDVKAEYDFIIIDTPPSKGPLTIASIKACTHLVIPAQMEEDSIDGVYSMMQLWKQETYTRSKDNPIELAGILANRVRHVSLHENFYQQLKSFDSTKKYLIEQKIQERVLYGELRVKDNRSKSIFSLNQTNPARQECIAACEAIMGRILTDA